MKIRLDFITNSSSSSFLILGVGSEHLIKQLLEAEGLKEYDSYDEAMDDGFDCCGYRKGKVVNFYGWDKNMYYAGWDRVSNMAEDMTLKQMRKKFIEEVYEKLGIKIDDEDVDLIVGEYGND